MKTVHCMPIMFFVIAGMFVGNVHADTVPSTTVVMENNQCIECHENSNAALVRDWRQSEHARISPVVDCVSCHGNQHQPVFLNARKDTVCIECHGGAPDPVVHSYSTSKHGSLMRIEKNQQDWTQPLSGARYRVPGCAYCHMHAGNHDVSESVRPDPMTVVDTEIVHDRIRAVCQDCHAPRYITRLLQNGEAMLEVARKKVREADALISQSANEFSEAQLAPARQLRAGMQQHLLNVYLGAGHQSPDYQWWHGQPALDGDLLRIKGYIGELRRAQSVSD